MGCLSPMSPAPPTDDADQHSRRVCSRRRRHFPSGLEKQPQSEHPPLADGSRPGYRQPGGSRGWEAVPGPWPPPRPAPQLLPLGPAPWVRHSRLCSGPSHQPHAGDGASLLPPPSLAPSNILWAPGSAHHHVPPHCPCTSLSFPVVLGHHIPQKSSQTRAVTGGGGGRGLVGPGPAPHCIPFGPPDGLCEPGCCLQAPGRWVAGPGNPPPPPLGRSLHTPGPGPSAAGTVS